MNKLYFIYLIGSFFNLVNAQSKFTGKVISGNIPLSNVEIINSTEKSVAKIDNKGEFQINAKLNDEIIIFLTGYLKMKLIVTNEHLNTFNKIILEKNTIELDEIEINKTKNLKIFNDYKSLKMAKISKQQSQPKVTGVYTGEFQNGIDFIEIGSVLVNQVSKIFKNKEKNNDRSKQISFRNRIQNEFSNDLLVSKLKLKEDEIDLFLNFCELDNKTKSFNDNTSSIELFDFLVSKRLEFKGEF
ncbi:hypothetical protein [Flavobacterium terrae]|uniref:hypothetical protein n=1 Tax=Flavobacterium terrae TaxID=415425 RepID=UPI0009351080|nr:hypothetical protein [Flavobacterium terrae]